MIYYMSESASSSRRTGPPSRGVTMSDVERAADACLREGRRPTIEKVRARLGTGSPNTINPLLDAWWKRLGRRLRGKLPAEDESEPMHRSLEAQIQELDMLLRKEQETRAAQAQRIAALEKELKARDRSTATAAHARKPRSAAKPRASGKAPRIRRAAEKGRR